MSVPLSDTGESGVVLAITNELYLSLKNGEAVKIQCGNLASEIKMVIYGIGDSSP